MVPDPSLLPQWGREFGKLVRQRQAGDSRARPYLGPVSLLYADEFVGRVRTQAERARLAHRQQVRQARAQTFEADYRQYLQKTEQRYQAQLPGLYAQFERQRQQSRQNIQSSLRDAAPQMLEWFDAEATRLRAFGKFFRSHPEHPVLSFDQ